MTYIKKMFAKMQNQKGAAKIEYVLLVALISVVAITALTSVGEQVAAQFGTVATKITPAT